MRNSNPESVSMRDFFAAGARALVNAQVALDARAEAVQDAAFAYTACRLRSPVEQPRDGMDATHQS